MSLRRAAAAISAIVLMIGLSALGQQEASPNTASKTQLELCMAAMPGIFKNYNNAKYAVFRAANSGNAAQMGGPVREAQAALDAMEQPLKGCYEASQNTQTERRQENKE